MKLIITLNILLKVVLLALLGVGFYGGVSVSYLTVTGIAPCPEVANIPACFIVTIGYLLMLIATLFNKKYNSKWIFIVGWTPVVLLAVVGSALELNQGNICPKSSAGLPLCYVSLGFAITLATLYWLLARTLNKRLLRVRS